MIHYRQKSEIIMIFFMHNYEVFYASRLHLFDKNTIVT